MGILADIREGLAANLATIEGADAHPYMLAAANAPFFEIYPDPETVIEYHKAFGNGVTFWTLCVRGVVGTVVDVEGQRNLDLWLEPTGATSVFAALESDKTLGGTVADLTVESCTGYQEYVKAGTNTTFMAAVWVVRIILAT